MEKKRFLKDNGFLTIVTALLMAMGVFSFFASDMRYYEKEMRTLVRKPLARKADLESGAYVLQYEEYLRDQSPLRTPMNLGNTQLRRLLGDRYIDDIYLCRRGKYMSDIKLPDVEQVKREIWEIRLMKTKEKNVTVMLIPDAASVQRHLLPDGANPAPQEFMMEHVKRLLGERIFYVDAYEALAGHCQARIYYDTDPALTSLGGYYVSAAYLENAGIPPRGVEAYRHGQVTDAFYGAYAHAGGFKKADPEKIYVFRPKNFAKDVLLKDTSGKVLRTSIYDTKALEGNNKRKVFLGDVPPVVKIETSAQNTRRLLILKDDAADVMIPFLIPYYHEIVVADTLRMTESPEALADRYKAFDVLFVFDGNRFFSGSALKGKDYAPKE